MAAQGGDIGFMGLLELFSGGAPDAGGDGALGSCPHLRSIYPAAVTAVVRRWRSWRAKATPAARRSSSTAAT
jgi:hypothetical protein